MGIFARGLSYGVLVAIFGTRIGAFEAVETPSAQGRNRLSPGVIKRTEIQLSLVTLPLAKQQARKGLHFPWPNLQFYRHQNAQPVMTRPVRHMIAEEGPQAGWYTGTCNSSHTIDG